LSDKGPASAVEIYIGVKY